MAGWRIEMLGGLRAVSDQTVVTHFESRKTAALLAYLALHPERVHPREELAALLWPDAEETSGRNRLKQALASLKKQLGAFFEADRFGVRVVPATLETDAAAWERHARAGRFREAAALWRGELLPGFYDEFLLDERERLNALKESLCPPEEETPPRQVFLPAPTTRFIGRATETARLATLLSTERWVTLTGPGGMGKTRLSQEIGRVWAEGDVVFVPLAPLGRTDAVPAAILKTLELPAPAARSPIDALCAFWKGRPVLLVLDNAEHLEREALAALCDTLLTRLPDLRLLVTSRRALDGAAEVRFPLEPLVVTQDAATLFLERARRIRPNFPDSAEIEPLCTLLEGMPLALELCAAWAGTLSAAQMHARLESGAGSALLTRRSGGEARHRSVEAVFQDSYQCLTPAQQTLLRGLSVFRGGWTLDAAGAVCPTDDTLSDLLALIDTSLIAAHGPERFGMLESLRRFAARLLEPAEQEALAARHRAWCAALIRDALGNPATEIAGLNRLDAEWANCRAAIESAPPAEAAALTLSLELYIRLRALGGEAIPYLEQAIESGKLSPALQIESYIRLSVMTGDRLGLPTALAHLDHARTLLLTHPEPRLQAALHYQAGRLAAQGGDYVGARPDYEAACTLWQEQNDETNMARAQHMLSQTWMMPQRSADLAMAREYMVRAEDIGRRTGRPSLVAEILLDRAGLALTQEDFVACLRLNEECEERCKALRHPRLLAKIANNIGEGALRMGDEERARRAYLDSLRGFCRLREWRLAVIPLWNLTHLYGQWEEYDIARVALAAVLHTAEETGQSLDEERDEIEALKAASEAALGPGLADHLWQQGRQLPIEEILQQIESRAPIKRP
jgi:predicted ATPase